MLSSGVSPCIHFSIKAFGAAGLEYYGNKATPKVKLSGPSKFMIFIENLGFSVQPHVEKGVRGPKSCAAHTPQSEKNVYSDTKKGEGQPSAVQNRARRRPSAAAALCFSLF